MSDFSLPKSAKSPCFVTQRLTRLTPFQRAALFVLAAGITAAAVAVLAYTLLRGDGKFPAPTPESAHANLMGPFVRAASFHFSSDPLVFAGGDTNTPPSANDPGVCREFVPAP